VTDSPDKRAVHNAKRMPRIVLLWVPVIAWMGLIFLLSAQSQYPTPKSRILDLLIEKTAHTVEYAILAALLARALRSSRSTSRSVFALAILVAGAYALTDEFHQRFVPGRSADWVDILFDWIGAMIGAALALYCFESVGKIFGRPKKP
jgi:VanZ family protein